MGRAALIIVVGLIIAVSIYSSTINNKINATVENYTKYYEQIQARNVATSTIQLALRKISDTPGWKTGYNNMSILGGVASLSVKDTIYTGKNSIKISCTGTYGKNAYSSTVFVQNGYNKPPGVRGAITAFGPVDSTTSDMWIDGRDHYDSLLSSTPPPIVWKAKPDSGIYAVSTGAPTFQNTARAHMGGTDRSVIPYTDHAPSFPEDPSVIQKNASWPNGFPRTPDAALGWDEGTLEAIAKSGINGSRYINATSTSLFSQLISTPVRGVTYVKVAPGLTAGGKSIKFSANPSGIFIFHSDSLDAWAKGITVNTDAPFKGLMIFDKVFHFHMDLLGSLVLLSANTDMVDACHGNQDRVIAYSSITMKAALDAATTKPPGGWRNRLTVLSGSWLE